MRYLFLILLFSLFSFCAAFAGQTGSLKPAAIPVDSLKIHIKYGDVNQDSTIDIFDLISILRHLAGSEPESPLSDLNNNGKTDIFDLLTFLHEFSHFSEGPPDEGFKVAASIRGYFGHRLTEPIVYSYSTFKNKNEVYDTYKIYSNREIVKVEFVFAGDTLTKIEGTTPVFFTADPDTIPIPRISYTLPSEPKEWKIHVWDAQGNCASDSGISKFMILLPDIIMDGGTSYIGNEIEFPLTLKGAWQRFGIKIEYKGIFIVDLNAEGRDSIIYNNIDDLAVAIMEEVAANDSLWHSTDIFGDPWPTLFIAPAVSRQTEFKSNRLVIKNESWSGGAVPIPIDGNEKLVSLIGFPKWTRSNPYIMIDGNYKPDSVIYNRYKSRK